MKRKFKKAIVYLLAVIIFFSALPRTVFADNADKVIVYVKTGLDAEREISIPSGKISENLTEVQKLVPKAQKSSFEKAVVITKTSGSVPVEVEISAIGTQGSDVIYYELDDYDGSSGIVLKTDQRIVFYYKTTYQIGYQCSSINGGGGNVGDSPTFIRAGENLHISLFPDKNSHPVAVKMIRQNQSVVDYSKKISGNGLTIPAGDITEDAIIDVSFENYQSYHIQRGTIANGIFCPVCSKNTSASETASGDTRFANVTVDQTTNNVVVPAGGSAIIPLYSNRTEGSVAWELNRLMLNGEDVKVPGGRTSTPVETILSDGTTVKVMFIESSRFNKGSCPHDAGVLRTRNLYYIYIIDSKGNYKIDANFKDTTRQEIIFKGLEGIASTGAAKESKTTRALPPDWGDHFYYTLYEDTVNNVYTYNDTEAVHVNMYVYKVKPGYNPYTVNVKGINTGLMNGEDDITQPEGAKVNLGYTITEMAAGAKGGSSYRHLDGTTGYDGGWRNAGGKENAFVPKSKENGYEFGFFLTDPPGSISNNQMIYLNASKYQYSVNYSLDGGEGTITDENHYEIGKTFYMPTAIPTKKGHAFQGWQLIDENGNVIDNTIYSRNQKFFIDQEVIQYAYGDKKIDTGLGFHFQAVWEKMSDTEELNHYTINYYRQVASDGSDVITKDGKYYVSYYPENVFLGVIDSSVIALNSHTTDVNNINWKKYILNEELSRLCIPELQSMEILGWEKNNQLYYYYDLAATGSLEISNMVTGTYSNMEKVFQYSIEINDPNAEEEEMFSVISQDSRNPAKIQNNIPTTVYLKHGDALLINELSKDTIYSIEEIADDYTATIAATIKNTQQDAEATITNNKVKGVLLYEGEVTDLLISFSNNLDYQSTGTGIDIENWAYIPVLLFAFAGLISSFAIRRKKR